jgi:predicted Zn-dependent protease
VHLLLKKSGPGDLDTARLELDSLLDRDPRDAEALMLRGFVHLRNNKTRAAIDALAAALKLDESLVEQEGFVEAVVQGYRDPQARRIADQMVAQTIRYAAIPAMRRVLAERSGDRMSHNLLASRLDKLGAGDDVDWVALAIEDLKATSCKVRKAAILTLVKERDQRAVGPLMKLAETRTCGSFNAKKAADAILKK